MKAKNIIPLVALVLGLLLAAPLPAGANPSPAPGIPQDTRQMARPTAWDGAAGDRYSESLSAWNYLLVAGAPNHAVLGKAGQGRVYIHQRNYNLYGKIRDVSSSDGAAGDAFGSATAVYSATMVIGAPGADPGTADQGAAYIFKCSPCNMITGPNWQWIEDRKLTANDGAAGEHFGTAVTLNRDWVVVGVPDALSTRGAVYLYYRHQGGLDQWGQFGKLTAPDGAAGDLFGHSVSLVNSMLAIGAPGAAVGGHAGQGAVYLFAHSNQGGVDQWTQVKKLSAGDGAAGDQFGLSVSLNYDALNQNLFVIAGAPGADPSGHAGQGAAYLYKQNRGGFDAWGLVKKLVAEDGAAGAAFGQSVTVYGYGPKVLVGAPQAGGTGAAYVFWPDLGGFDNFGQNVRLVPSDAAAGDEYGASTAATNHNIYAAGAPGANNDRGKATVFVQDSESESYGFVLANQNYETPNYLIDRLIADGHGNQTFVEVMAYLQSISGTIFPDRFMTRLNECGPTTQVRKKLSDYAGVQYSLEVRDLCDLMDWSTHISSEYVGQPDVKMLKTGGMAFLYKEGDDLAQTEFGSSSYLTGYYYKDTRTFHYFALAYDPAIRIFMPVVLK